MQMWLHTMIFVRFKAGINRAFIYYGQIAYIRYFWNMSLTAGPLFTGLISAW